jgi:hypothetical protein
MQTQVLITFILALMITFPFVGWIFYALLWVRYAAWMTIFLLLMMPTTHETRWDHTIPAPSPSDVTTPSIEPSPADLVG